MPHATASSPQDTISVFPDTTAKYGDWRDQLFQEGYAIIPDVISPEKSAGYVEAMYVSMICDWPLNCPEFERVKVKADIKNSNG